MHLPASPCVSLHLAPSHESTGATPLCAQAAERVELSKINYAAVRPSRFAEWGDEAEAVVEVEVAETVGPLWTPKWQYFYKPVEWHGAKTAVLLMNHGGDVADLSLSFADIPGVSCTKCALRELWSHTDLGTFDGGYTAKAVGSHDCVFLIVTPAAAPA